MMITSNKTWKIVSRTFLWSVVVLLLCFIAYLFIRLNIHTVIPGTVYRSAELPPAVLQHVIKKHHIRSIINLRGSWPDDRWYKNEMRVSQELGIKHYDIRFWALRMPTRQMLQKLVTLLQTAPKPLLIHCKSGSDRTGLAASIVLILHGASLAQAEKQYAWYYLVVSSRSIGRLVIPRYANWLQRNHFKSSKQHFLQWLAQAKLARFAE